MILPHLTLSPTVSLLPKKPNEQGNLSTSFHSKNHSTVVASIDSLQHDHTVAQNKTLPFTQLNAPFFMKNLTSTETKQLVVFISTVFLWSGSAFGQCNVTPCASAHQTFIDLATVPECGVGSVDLTGDVQNNQPDCELGALNCHEFIIYRAPSALTQQFTLQVGQGNGCTGELDFSLSYIDGICDTLSNGGSNTQVTFTFPFGVDTVHLFFCINSGAAITVCDLCSEPPP